MDPNFSQDGYLKSMTAYGRGVVVFSYGRFTIEIQSVNRRYLEINVGLPRQFIRFEIEIRKIISASIGRGMINVSVSWKADAKQPISVTPNLPLAKGVKKAWETLTAELGINESVPLNLLAKEADLLLYEDEFTDEEVYRNALSSAMGEALKALLIMKRQEGATLAKDLKERVKVLQAEIAYIEAHSGEGSEKYRQKLTMRLNEFFTGSSENEERVLREVAVYAERIDVTEEIVRFKSHLVQFGRMVERPLDNELETRGKTLDFLLQELLREINTIGSKASDLGIAQHVITVKSELEKIREQVQNIE